MPAAKLRPVGPSIDRAAAGHVLAAVVADALDDGAGARVAHREALARQPAEERAAGRRAVEHGVADRSRSPRPRTPRRRAGGRRARRRTGPCRCSRSRRRSASARRPGASQAPNDCPAEPRSVKRIVSGGSPSAPCTLVTALESSPPTVRLTLRIANSPVTGRRWSIASLAASISVPVERARQRRVLRAHAPQRRARRAPSGMVSTCVRSTPRAFQWSIASSASSRSTRPIRSSKRAHAEPAHHLAHLLGDEEEEVDDVLGRALEALAQLRVLRRDADRARVEVAGAHHDAARRRSAGRSRSPSRRRPAAPPRRRRGRS